MTADPERLQLAGFGGAIGAVEAVRVGWDVREALEPHAVSEFCLVFGVGMLVRLETRLAGRPHHPDLEAGFVAAIKTRLASFLAASARWQLVQRGTEMTANPVRGLVRVGPCRELYLENYLAASPNV